MQIKTGIDGLNPAQREAVTSTEGPLLVLAGAGSGKTRVITMRVAWLTHLGVPPGSILAVTFTNKAAREMKERVKALLGRPAERVKSNRNGPDAAGGGRPVISTFHSLCLNILKREIEALGYRKDFTIYDTGEQVSLLRHILSDIKVFEKSFKPEDVLEKISRFKNGFLQKAPIKGGQDDFDAEAMSESLLPRYQETMRSLNVVDFDDLLLLTLRLFREHPEALEKYRKRFLYIMVDEYQDTNKVQYDILKLLSGERKNICVVGDDDQSIYGWRGASLNNILDFEKTFPGTKIVRLEQNYRSFGNILSAANGVIKNNSKRMEKSLRTDRGAGPRVCVYRAENGELEAQWIAGRIAEIKFGKDLKYEDFAIIYRANTLSKPFEEALRSARIPYTVVGGTSYFDRKEIKDLASYLKLIANNSDSLSLLRSSSVPKRGLGAATTTKLTEFAKAQSITLLEAFKRAGEVEGVKQGRQAGAAESFALMIEKYSELFKKRGQMGNTFKALAQEIGFNDYINELYKSQDMAFKRMENAENFIQSLHHYEEKSLSEFPEKAPTLQEFLEQLALDSGPEEKEEKPFGVVLTTFHSAKGLEFPVVFIACLEEDVLPHKKSALPGEDIEEERRLFYVGITRAMKELYLTCAKTRMKYGKQVPLTPSRFLDEIPADVIRKVEDVEPEDTQLQEERIKDFFAKMREI
ncbi:MAG: UvrD-helicase domain-containing protein [Nitrospiraceae bacterium]|nr:UvrD-helicase domain-containing protein [Nitrospiraceae bacterium]